MKSKFFVNCFIFYKKVFDHDCVCVCVCVCVVMQWLTGFTINRALKHHG